MDDALGLVWVGVGGGGLYRVGGRLRVMGWSGG